MLQGDRGGEECQSTPEVVEMKRLVRWTLVVAVFVGVIMPSTALASGFETLDSFSLSPSCTHPGGTVAATASWTNQWDGTVQVFARVQATYLGHTVATSPTYGPLVGEFGGTQSYTWPIAVPWYALFGPYNLVLTIGPSRSDPVSEDSRSATLTVAPFPFC
jgi:hypothetical protein